MGLNRCNSMKGFGAPLACLALAASVLAFAGKIQDRPLPPLKAAKSARKALVLTNPYATGKNTFTNFGPSGAQNPVVVVAPASTGTTGQLYTFPSLSTPLTPQSKVSPVGTVGNMYTPVDPSTLTTVKTTTIPSTSYNYLGDSLTNVNLGTYNALQARVAAKTLDNTPPTGIGILDGLFNRANSAISSIGNSANGIIGGFANYQAKINTTKGQLAQSEANMSAGNYASSVDFANKINQINNGYDQQMSSIQAAASNSGVSTQTGLTKPSAPMPSTYATGYRKEI